MSSLQIIAISYASLPVSWWNENFDLVQMFHPITTRLRNSNYRSCVVIQAYCIWLKKVGISDWQRKVHSSAKKKFPTLIPNILVYATYLFCQMITLILHHTVILNLCLSGTSLLLSGHNLYQLLFLLCQQSSINGEVTAICYKCMFHCVQMDI